MKNSRNRRCLVFLTVIFVLSLHLSFVSFPPYLALAVLPSNSSFYSYYRCFVTRPCERAVTKLAQCRSQVKPREDGARTLFFSFTRVRSQPMASDLSCVTLLPRPDRTGKLIAKVKRNKGATPSESLGRLREGGREKEREVDRRACRDREKGRKKQAGRGGKREREAGKERYKMLSIGTSRPGNRFPRSIPRSSREAQADTLDLNFLSKDVP